MTQTTHALAPIPAALLRLIVVIVVGLFGAHCPHPSDDAGASHHGVSATVTLHALATSVPSTGGWQVTHDHAPNLECERVNLVLARLARAIQDLPIWAMSAQPLTILAVPLSLVMLAALATLLRASITREPSELGVMRH
jgi:hypothetical protein